MKKILTLLAMAIVIMVIYPDTTVARNDEGYVNVSGLHLRSSPESTRDGVTHTDNVITTLAYGDRVIILANVHGWLRVQSRGREGYVWNTFITVSNTPLLAPIATQTPSPVQVPVSTPITTEQTSNPLQAPQTHESINAPILTAENEISVISTVSQLSPDLEAEITDFLLPLQNHGFTWSWIRGSIGLLDHEGNLMYSIYEEIINEKLHNLPFIRFDNRGWVYLFYSFSLVDIDGSGVPEIIVDFLHETNINRNYRTEVYRFIDGEFRIIDTCFYGQRSHARYAQFFVDSQGSVVLYRAAGMGGEDESGFLHSGEGFYRLTINDNVINSIPIVTLVVEEPWLYMVTNHITGEALPLIRSSQNQEGNWPPFGLRNWVDGEWVQFELSYIPTMPHETLNRYNAFDALISFYTENLSINPDIEVALVEFLRGYLDVAARVNQVNLYLAALHFTVVHVDRYGIPVVSVSVSSDPMFSYFEREVTYSFINGNFQDVLNINPMEDVIRSHVEDMRSRIGVWGAGSFLFFFLDDGGDTIMLYAPEAGWRKGEIRAALFELNTNSGQSFFEPIATLYFLTSYLDAEPLIFNLYNHITNEEIIISENGGFNVDEIRGNSRYLPYFFEVMTGRTFYRNDEMLRDLTTSIREAVGLDN